MSRFIQLHLISFYPPANLNRDDTGRPKTAIVGGATRLRLSSQALKRAWRTSDLFKTALAGHMGSRTQRMGEEIVRHLVARGSAPDTALKIVREIIPVFGKPKGDKDPNPARTEQLAFIAPQERAAAFALAEKMADGAKAPVKPEDILVRTDTAADIALFGRMLADAPDFNREAACQVAHAITTHRVTVEDDYYTAVDDLKTPAEDAGAGFLGEAAFGSGTFYLYICIDRTLLEKNLGGGEDAKALAGTAIAALVEAAATTAPRGKQNSYAAHGIAHHILAEKGDRQPRTLAGAFAKPVADDDLVGASITALGEFRDAIDKAYVFTPLPDATMTVGGEGTLPRVIAFCRE